MANVYSTRPRAGRLAIVALLASAMVFVTMPPAQAAAPAFQERWEFSEPAHHDDFLSDVCGTDIYASASGKGKVKFYENGRIVDHFNVESKFWNPATGDMIISQEAATFDGMGVEVFDPDDDSHDDLRGHVQGSAVEVDEAGRGCVVA